MTLKTPMAKSPSRMTVFLGALAALSCFCAGVATTVLAQSSARTYSTKGKVTSVQGGKLLIKDKFGGDWEYDLPKGLSTAVGKDIKVVYVMQAVKIEAP